MRILFLLIQKSFFSVYNTGFEGELNKNFGNKAILDGVDLQDVADLEKPTAHEVYKHAVKWSDGVILGSENIDSSLVDFINESNKPTLEFQKRRRM